ncbi:MAG TPA: metal-dependent hydrolase [Aggregatilinea sp.]|uniref:metal-dependent hydrolase n=1 Tax=Aggregatilinea sp. TaxID=2806333 RepID=UPI002CCF2E9C|nr:metal-dependent hydrolase [Aggregatilinea sp.]HML24451.1 metal-dependent hydrolase [Aggregatilinea sp.]
MTIQVTWLGHSAFALKIGTYDILIDPFLTGNPLAAADPKEIPADFILVSHGHGDHIGDTTSIAKRTGATVVANNEIGRWFRSKHGLEKVHTLNPGGGIKLPFGRVELTIAHHSSSLPDGSYGGEPNGILIFTDEGKNIYHAGDTNAFLDMQLIGEHGLDLAILPIGDYFTMGTEGSLKAIELLKPKCVIPMHYNTFDAVAQDVVVWAQRVNNETDAKPVVLDPGGTFEL